MASSFSFFRKHTGIMMVFLCGAAMLAFVVADPLLQYLDSAGRSGSGGVDGDTVAVSWDGGEMTEDKIGSLVNRRQVLARFLGTVAAVGRQAAEAEGAIDPQPLVAPLDLPYTYEQGVERNVVSTHIFAEAAREAGIVVSDETIRDYLTDVGYRKVPRDQMREILEQMGGGGRNAFSVDYIFDLLRDALLARNYLASYTYQFQTVLPEQRYQDWLKVNDRVVVEAAAIDVADLVSEVEDPSDAELQEFYEQYKERVPQPMRVGNIELPSPTPGFSTPSRVVLQYAMADLASEAKKQEENVTDEEIEKFYEENKSQFIEAGALLGDDEEDDLGLEEDSTPDTEQGTEEGPADDQQQMKEDTESDDSAEDSTDSASEETEVLEEEAETPSSDEQADSSEEETAAQPAAGESSSALRKSPFRLVAYQEDAGSDQEGNSSADGESPASESSEAASDDSDASESDSAGDEPADATEALFGTDEPEENSASATVDLGSDKSDEAEEVNYQPLDEVRDQIRARIAEQKAVEAMVERMNELYAPLDRANSDYLASKFDAQDAGKEVPTPPQILADLKPLAEEHGLEFVQTADLSLLELRDSSIGKTYDPSRRNQRTGQPFPLWAVAFDKDGLKLNQAVVTYDSASNGYLALKTEQTDGKTPELDAIRDQVVRAWKMQQAAELAVKRAEELAAKAEPSGLSLKDFFASEEDIEVTETNSFSWLTQGQFVPTARQIPLRLSQPEGVQAVGPEFMKETFELAPGKLGVALNNDKTIAYIIRIVQHEDSPSELRDAFLELGETEFSLYGFIRNYQRQSAQALINGLLNNSELEWQRPADQLANQ